MRPSAALNEIILGILGRAQQAYQVQICGFSFLSNHFHILLVVDHAKQLADFMGYVNSNLAREAGRLNQWREKFWSRRYRAIVVSQEEGAQRERLKYVLAHGAKEGLVDHPREWPGVHAIRALVEDEPLEGYWFDRTQEYAARRRGKEHERLEFATRYSVVLSPLPCWAHLSPEQQRARVTDVVHEIEDEANQRREETGRTSPGPDAIRRQNPHEQPQRSKKSPAPLFHAVKLRVKKSSTPHTPASLPPFGRRPRNGDPETAPWSSPLDATRPHCPSWRDEAPPCSPSAGRVCADRTER